MTELKQLLDDGAKPLQRIKNDGKQKWLHRSALQKAVRRGRVEDAHRHAEYLFGSDLPYLRYSLAIIGVEDVCAGDVSALILSQRLQSAEQRKGLDEAVILAALIERYCNAVKSRAQCEVLVYSIFVDDRVRSAIKMTPDALVEAAIWDDDPATVYVALSVLAGQPLAPVAIERSPRLEQHIDKVVAYAATVLDPVSAEAVEIGLKKPVCPMNTAVWPVLKCLSTAVAPEVEDEVFPPEEYIEGFCSAAYDQHTMEGKKALMAFYTSLSRVFPQVKEWIPKEKAVASLGNLVFNLEGALVDRRLVHFGTDEAKTGHDRLCAYHQGVPAEHYDELAALVLAEIPRLNSKRKWVMGL